MNDQALLQFLEAHQGRWDDAGHLHYPTVDLARWTLLCRLATPNARRLVVQVVLDARARRWQQLTQLTAQVTREAAVERRRVLRETARRLQRELLEVEPLERLVLGLLESGPEMRRPVVPTSSEA